MRMHQRKYPRKRVVHTEIKDEVSGITYRMLQEVGQGAYGRVYSAININEGSTVAIKQIPLTKLSDEQTAEIRDEVKLLETLQDPHIVSYLDSVENDHYLNIIMEYVESGSLCDMMKQFPDHKMPEKLVAIYIKQVLKGLVFLHGQGVIHRDVKGANLLLTSKGQVKLADFGVAVATKKGQGQQAVGVVGTAYWMAPEVIEMREQTTACDIWSVGSTTLELLTGAPPYYHMQTMSAMYHIVQDEHPPLDIAASDLCKDFLLYCFLKNPQQRPSASFLLRHPWIKRHCQDMREEKVDGSVKGEPDFFGEDMDGFSIVDEEDGGERYNSPESKGLEHYREKCGDDIPDLEEEERINIKDFNSGVTAGMDGDYDSDDMWDDIENGMLHEIDEKQKFRLETRDLLKKIHLDHFPDCVPKTDTEKIKIIQDTVTSLKQKFLTDLDTVCEEMNNGIIAILEVLDINEKEIVIPILDLIYTVCSGKTPDKIPDEIIIGKGTAEGEDNFVDDNQNEPVMQISESSTHTEQTESSKKMRKRVLLNLCQFGFIPKIAKFTRNFEVKDIQDKSMEFLKEFCNPHISNRQIRSMFLASNGIKVLVELLNPSHYTVLDKTVEPLYSTIFKTIDCMIMVLEDGMHPKNDFCRLFTKSGLLHNLVIILHMLLPKTLEHKDDTENMKYAVKCSYIFQVFAQQGSSDDRVVQKQLLNKKVIKAILTLLQQQGEAEKIAANMERTLLNLLKSIKFIAMKDKSKLIEEKAIRYIASYLRIDFPQALQYQCILSMFYMLKIDPKAREQAAKIGTVIPRLQSRLRYNAGQGDPCMVFAVETLQRFPLEASTETMQELKKHGGVDFYLWMIEESNRQALLSNPMSVKATWQNAALTALANWMSSATRKRIKSTLGSKGRTLKHRVELVICQPSNVTTLILAFKQPFEWRYFSKILESMQKLCKYSERLTFILASSELFLTCLCEKLRKTLEWIQLKDNKKIKKDIKKDINVLLREQLTFETHLFNRQRHLDREQIYRILAPTLKDIGALGSLQLIAKQARHLLKLIKV